MIGIYFSGTGNTEYCIKKFVSVYAPGSPIISIEDNSILAAINQHQEIILAYPIYYSEKSYRMVWEKDFFYCDYGTI